MRVLALHSRYRQRGGEDESFDADTLVIRERGHEVVEFVRAPTELTGVDRYVQAGRVVWNRAVAAELTSLVRRSRPDVAYLNNHFPALSASAMDVLGREGIATVLVVRNYRFACAPGLLYRDGKACDLCSGRRVPTPAVRHRCYKGGLRSSVAAAAALVAVTRTMDRHRERITYAADSLHMRRFLVEDMGFRSDRVHVRANTLRTAMPPNWAPEDYLLFAGRLEPEKGIRQAIDAVTSLPGVTLVVAGTGSLEGELRRDTRTDRVRFLGARPHAEVVELMSRARATVVTSQWDEPFGRVAMESLACGTPVVATDRGALPELVEDGVSGIVVPAGDHGRLREAVRAVHDDPSWGTSHRHAARQRFDACFSREVVGGQIEAILTAAVGAA